MADRKKEEELHLVRLLAELLPGFPDGDVVDWEGPDFLISHESGVLGVEVTRWFRAASPGRGPLQEQESLQTQVCERARCLYEDGGGAKLRVHVLFSGARPLRKPDTSNLADLLSRAVRCAEPWRSRCSVVNVDPIERALGWRPFSQVWVYRERSVRRGSWSPLEAGFVESLTPEHIQALLDDKQGRMKAYRKCCTMVWLLIAYQLGHLSSTVDATAETFRSRYRTGFDRVFLLNLFDKNLYELQRSCDPIAPP